MTQDILFYVILAVCFGVVVILALGLGSFAKGGKDSAKFSNKMMRYRIIAQAVAVLLIVILVALRGTGN
ncbi:twin transmembrane helix small protein [Aliishimia ponticola]|uniref:Twin transmembrane helix small protein n=1 Tax=Aliishimia ponticola TaxID=2499833 RepID=A0A4S4N789_9RHOB|nr:twin transmembrane helix small protein [Aliishimia ponticola]THH35026.1 twin transmembrane helix small protein [Aliishimia ponticola]